MNVDLILKEIEDNQEDYIEFLRELIKTDSYNPPGNEKNVALKIKEYLKKEGIKCEIYPFEKNRANLLAYLNENFDGKNLLFNGHMDVVPPGLEEKWKYPPLSAFIKKRRMIFGRGAVDMKGGLCAMVIALKILKKINFQISGNLILNAVADEETGGKFGSEWSLKNPLKSINCDFVVIGEPTRLRNFTHAILVGEKGHLQIKIVTNGISCHSSIPSLGKNAISMMGEIMQKFDNLSKYFPNVNPPISFEDLKKLISIVFPNEEAFNQFYNNYTFLQKVIKTLTETTISINMINGGIKANVIPDRCEAVVDFRMLPGHTPEIILNGLKKFINDLGYPVMDAPTGGSDKVFIYLEVIHQTNPSYWKDWEESKALKCLLNTLKQVYNRKPFIFLSPAGADARYFRNSNYCNKTVLFGPGNVSSAHASDENLEIKDFINAIKTYTLFAFKFLK